MGALSSEPLEETFRHVLLHLLFRELKLLVDLCLNASDLALVRVVDLLLRDFQLRF